MHFARQGVELQYWSGSSSSVSNFASLGEQIIIVREIKDNGPGHQHRASKDMCLDARSPAITDKTPFKTSEHRENSLNEPHIIRRTITFHKVKHHKVLFCPGSTPQTIS
jgi:hypothetical protein